SGVLLKIAVESGEVPVGQTVAVIGEEGEAIPDVPSGAAGETVSEAPPEEETRAPDVAETTAGLDAGEDRVKASPLARRMARERGIELAGLRGTGPDGRIVAEDVERAESAPELAPAAPVAAAAVESVPLTSVRKTIARRLA